MWCASSSIVRTSMLVVTVLALLPAAVAAALPASPATPVADLEDGGPLLREGMCGGSTCGPGGYAGSLPAQLTSRGGRLFFAADDRRHGYELWISDGTADTTRLVTDLCPGRCGSDPVVVGWLGDELLFWAREPRLGRELWATDGTTEGTRLVRGFCAGDCDGDHTPYPGARPFEQSWWEPEPPGRRFGDVLLFPVRQRDGTSVWATAGRRRTTRPVRLGCAPGTAPEDCRPITFAVARDAVYLAGADGALWRTGDVSTEARQVVPPCPAAPLPGDPPGGLAAATGVPTAVRADGRGAYLVRECRATAEVFHVQGGEPEGRRVLSFTTVGARVARRLVGGRLVIVEQPSAGVARLWTSDGTAAGSGPSGELPGVPRRLGTHGGRLYLGVRDQSSQQTSLWVSDGTADGTLPLLDDGVISFVEGVGPYVAFFTVGEEGGQRCHELWMSDGTPAGTGPVQRFPFRLEDDELRSTPLLHAAAGRLYLSVDVGDMGQELWSLPRAAANPYGCVPDGQRLCLGAGRFAVTVVAEGAGGEPWPARALSVDGLPPDGRAGLFALAAPRPSGAAPRPSLIVKVLDGGAVNGRHWVLHGGLPDRVYETAGYTVKVRDLRDGVSRLYRRAPGDLCGGADLAAFRALSPVAAAPVPAAAVAPGACGADALCLHGGRFTARVELVDGTPATPVPWDDGSGRFHFFAPDNPELLLRLVDGRRIDGSFWLLWGGATSLGYRLTVSDGLTGEVRVIEHPAGDLCGGVDVDAF